MNIVAGATTLGELASALAARAEEASVVADLKAGSEDAYAWLVEQYHQQIYSLVYRIVSDPADAADATQEVFLKVFRGMNRFNGGSSLKTWMYRIAVHEAANQRRWWFRHKGKETSIESTAAGGTDDCLPALKDTLEDGCISPFEALRRTELMASVEKELRQIPEPYRTTVVLRDLEELSYEEIAEVMETTLGTVKSRLLRGRGALKERLVPILRRRTTDCTRKSPERDASPMDRESGEWRLAAGSEFEVTS